jgi:glutamine synthetase
VTIRPTPEHTSSEGDVLRAIDEANIDFVRCLFIDFIGIGRGRAVRREYLPTVLREGLSNAKVNLTLDVDDHETDLQYGSQSGDLWAVPDPASFVRLPFLRATGHMFCDLVDEEGVPWPSCPRTNLRRLYEVVQQELGTVFLGFEQEGYVFGKEGESYAPLYRGRVISTDLLDFEDDFISELSSAVLGMGIGLEKITAEGGWGMFEVNFRQAEPLMAVEQYFRYKEAFRAIARRHGYIGSFMPKPFQDGISAGLHVHVSLVDRSNGADLLGGSRDKEGEMLSALGRHFLGGLMTHAGALVALGSPSVNSYKRLQPGSWAPTHATYGVGNRSAMVRIVQSRSAEGTPLRRLEIRSADGTCNPYQLASAILAAGLDGVRRGLDPGSPIGLDVSRLNEEEMSTHGLQILPRSLDRALDALEADEIMAELIGPALVAGFIKAKRSEWAKFASHVTDWEHRTYAEFH